MSAFLLDRAYLVEEADGVPRHRAVVPGSDPDHCRLPAGPNAPGTLGITTHAQSREGRAVTVRRLGLAPWEAAEAFPAGSALCVDGADGRAQAARTPRALVGTESTNGAFRLVSPFPAERHFLLRVAVTASGTESDLLLVLEDGELAIQLATDGLASAVSTAAEVVAAVNADPVLSLLVRAELAGGDGSAIAATGEAPFTGHEESIHVVGISQQASTGAGDVVDVLLTP